MEEKIKYEDYFTHEIDPAVEVFVRHLVLYSLHENNFISLKPMSIKRPVQIVGDAVRIYRHYFRSPIENILTKKYPTHEELTEESHRGSFFVYFLWFCCLKDFKKQSVFLIVTALAMEDIYVLWEKSELPEERTKCTLFILASVFSSKEFKKCYTLDGLVKFAEFVVSIHKKDLTDAQDRPRNGSGYRKLVAMDYLSRNMEREGERLISLSEVFQKHMKKQAEEFSRFVEVLEMVGENKTELLSLLEDFLIEKHKTLLKEIKENLPAMEAIESHLQTSETLRLEKVKPAIERTFRWFSRSLPRDLQLQESLS